MHQSTTPTNMLSSIEANFVAASLAQHPRSIPEPVMALDWTQCAPSLNPEEWGLTLDDVRETYRRLMARDMEALTDPVEREQHRQWYLRVTAAQELKTMCCYLGHYWLAALAQNKQTRPAIDPDHIMTAAEMLAIIAAG